MYFWPLSFSKFKGGLIYIKIVDLYEPFFKFKIVCEVTHPLIDDYKAKASIFNPLQREDTGQSKYTYKFVQLDRTMQKRKACNNFFRLKRIFR